MHHRITYVHINFQKIWVNIDATYNSNFETKLLSDMHHRITYMIINFQQDRVSRSVKTVHTNLFANNRKLHKFATCN